MTEVNPLPAHRTAGATLNIPRVTATSNSVNLAEAMARATWASYGQVSRTTTDVSQRSFEEQLFDSLASCKIATRRFLMHFDAEWEKGLFKQLDMLMDKDEWDPQDQPVTSKSFSTFIRLMLKLRTARRLGVGIANHGNLVVSWSVSKQDRLTIECAANDHLRWIVSRMLDGQRESAAGVTDLSRIRAVLEPYEPEHWLNEGPKPPG